MHERQCSAVLLATGPEEDNVRDNASGFATLNYSSLHPVTATLHIEVKVCQLLPTLQVMCSGVAGDEHLAPIDSCGCLRICKGIGASTEARGL